MENNVGLILAKRAFVTPDVDGYVDGDTGATYSFAELDRRANRTANLLRARGVGKGDRVGILLMNSVEFTELFFAVAKIGAVNVPLNWRLVPDELEFILADSGAKTLVFDEDFEHTVRELHGRGDKTAVSDWVQVVAEGGTKLDFAGNYAALQAAADDAEPPVTAVDEDPVYIMYTSGTTGLPKGAVHTHNSCFWACFTFTPSIDMQRSDRFYHLLPMFHVGALTPVTLCVYAGVPSVVARSFDPQKAWEVIEREKITVMLAVPAMLNFMMQVPEFATRFDYSSLRWCMSGAAPVPVTLIERYAQQNIEVHQVYGLTETCGPACVISAEYALSKAGSTGKAFFHTSVRVVDDAGNDCAPGEPGEVLVSGRHLMKEYWRRPEATAEAIVDGWLHTGDIATMDEDGFIFIMDRTKDMIISGGENIYPAELENIILGHEQIAEVAVIGQPSDRWGESPFAVAVRKDESLTEQQLLDWCFGKMARFKQPQGAAFVDEIPRNPSGKVLKRVLREQFPGPAAQ